MNSFKDYVCLKTRSHICYSIIHFSVVVISLFIVATVFSQTRINFAEDGDYALQFDGIDDYVSINGGGGIAGLNETTITLWVKWIGNQDQGSPGYGVIFGRQNDNVFTNQVLTLSSENPDLAKVMWYPYTAFDPAITSSTQVGNEIWRHIAVSYSPGNHKLYIDGKLERISDMNGSINSDTSIALTIGGGIDDIESFSRSQIDEIAIWNRALTQTEIQGNIFTHLSGDELALIGYWPLNSGTGTTIYDMSGSNNHGKINGAIWISSGAPLGKTFIYVDPAFAHLNTIYNGDIRGANTNFSENEGTLNVWISKNDTKVYAKSFQVLSNTSLTVEILIPSNVSLGLWDMNIETSVDSVISLENAIEIVQEGNYALQFDGFDDFVDCGYDSRLNFDAGDSFTIESWILVDHVDDEDTHLMGTWGNSDIGFYILRVMSGDGKLSFEIEDINSQSNQISNGKKDLRDGKWHHVVGVRDKNTNRLYQYVDGVLDGVSDDHTTGSLNGNHRFSIGQRFDGYGHHYGRMDEVRVWKRILSQEEIQINMYQHLSGFEESLVGYWPFNEGAGSQTIDLSGGNNHGVLMGATWVGSSAPVGRVIIFCHPNYGYQNHNLFTTIQGANTHFSDGTKSVWLSKEDKIISADRYNVTSNTLIDAKFYIPLDAVPGQWNINVETTTDSVIIMPIGLEVLPPPSVTPKNSATSSWLRSVYAINDQTCWSAGNDGIIQMTKDGGETWQLQESGTSNVLYSIFLANSMTGWAVGQYGTILSTTNGGAEWTSQTSGTSNNLQSVYFIDPSVGWAVGSSGTVLKTTDGGITWESQNSGTSSWLYSTCFIDANNGWTVGNNGSILKTSDGGTTWNPQTSGTTDYLFSVHFIYSNTGWIGGSDGLILKTHDGGINWLPQESNTSSWLRSVYFKDSNMGWATGNNGLLMMTTDGGENWSSRKTWTNKTLNSIYFIDDHAGWIVGEAGTVLSMTMSNLATQIEEKNISSPFPQDFQLFQNYPNPFNPTTAIGYRLLAVSDVKLGIYNMLGQKVATLISGRQKAGYHQVEWDASRFSSGIYYYRIKAGEFQDVKKMILIR